MQPRGPGRLVERDQISSPCLVFTWSRAGRPIDATTVGLFKRGTPAPVAAAVTYDASTRKAVLNPEANLKRGARYEAVVGTGARDLADNALDQRPALAGD